MKKGRKNCDEQLIEQISNTLEMQLEKGLLYTYNELKRAGGGMMMLLILTSVLGYELKTAVGTSVFIMAFTAFTGAASHFAIGGMPDVTVWILCIVFTFIWARIAAVFANKASTKTLNRATGIILVVLGIVVMLFSLLS